MENNIVSWITGKSDLKQVPVQELKDIVHQYPYFTLAQLLLTVKMKRENNPEYPQQLQKTALNFQNPQWLHFQLESLHTTLDAQEKPASNTENISESIAEEAIPAAEITETNIEANSIEATESTAETVPNIESATISENILDTAAQAQSSHTAEDFPEDNIEAIAEETLSHIETEDSPENILENVEENSASNITGETALPQETVSNTETENLSDETQENRSADTTETENEGNSRLSAILEAQAASFKSTEAPKEKLSFDSPALLPAKDYFASIGITIDHSIQTDFGQKVKRFSDWLKQMKRIGADQMDKNAEPSDSKIILQKADDSNKASAILTETMVDILVQQGKKQEAIDILEKLSLLKPEKSTYFASLINNLKNS